MNKVIIWVVDKILVASLVLLVLFTVYSVYLSVSIEGDHLLSFELNMNYLPSAFEVSEAYLESPEKDDYILYSSKGSLGVYVSDSPKLLRFFKYCPLVIGFILLYNLWLVVRSVSREGFFAKRNVNRLRWVAVANFLLGLYKLLDELIGVHYLNNLVLSEDRRVSYNLFGDYPNLTSSFFVGLLVLIIAEAFAHGLKLKEEQELTI
ncbi:DUF2975 domain-containing protein [Roseivirga pacifica]|uniref:DUF2975 domain-containing protein n=1 Tax=Roseivirga pacifica TaxID=1267423 RepID=UPI002096590E|nr:DUF2975 domain-containing protein [Roseivirga pacifica]MCO6359943.1 DUF2975 domain-containing protein [Roseivirga pacifica]MCO6367313.1 DUF2975 domain-containing protein [Roseivirga pacifica]MCO6370155.1 DUF2975 domain-containing protein [Roseivirga pacifica]MCO6374970.1 DUF2975 domain-containing protein [Roseivirga pacifica]MCO6380228.1 DUF2975 domain-containing protein [Roseivirga pacifica]